ncbi:MAG: hypothetical protein MUP81_01670 [Dehalococcoidia bacterium]|nr:hypothetical protein [Dehalococcoidia bacterium]
MKWLKRRRLRKHIERINFPGYLAAHGRTGEYDALKWLEAYVEGRACAEPMELVNSMLSTPNGMNSRDCLYVWTLLRWC